MITAFHSLVIASHDLAKDAASTARLLGVSPTDSADTHSGVRFDLGNVALALIESEGREGLVQTQFSVADGTRWARRLKNLGLADAAAGPREKPDTSALHIRSRGLDLGFTEHQRRVPEAANLSCLNGVDHVVVSTDNPDGCAALFGARLGLDMRLDLTRPDWNARLMFFRVGDAILEIVQSTDMPSPADQDGFFGISWRTADAETSRTRLHDAGFSVSEVRDGRKPGSRVFTVRDAPCGVPTLVIQPPVRA